ncbi:hypothetical protein [Bombilactobacillus bombi]|uniref:hypothetical protein n=1 Tax=Bombilactobacillus bombi TaxID=1303590 RepID=UPI0015E5C456|nr:hypothetical protein [Bombilactobacillus bombi]
MKDLKVKTELIRKQTIYDIKWEFVKINQNLQGVLEYHNEIYNQDDIRKYKDKFINTLQKFVQNK